MQSAEAPDLKTYDPGLHTYVALGSETDMKFVMNYRALLQANNDIRTLGEAKKGMYSYEVHLWRIPIVIAVDMSARWNPNDLWIQEHCFDVLLTGPCWSD